MPRYESPSSLIFLSPTIRTLGFWEVLWAVGITNFIIKFLFMGIKCLILLLPSSVVNYKTQVRSFFFILGLGIKKNNNLMPLHLVAFVLVF